MTPPRLEMPTARGVILTRTIASISYLQTFSTFSKYRTRGPLPMGQHERARSVSGTPPACAEPPPLPPIGADGWRTP